MATHSALKCLSVTFFVASQGALFQSPHADENDVQTISHKCEVLSWQEYRASRSAGDESTADTYYLAGNYDPYANVITVEPSLAP
ncbi:hypothetical protein HPB47_010230 [Ixodes persulcatus]|uniref:Uncharacterized protein n=1 Tax=Ixodes persulcatus TaxID=34615 RepID=A0AC60P000_IXOPE|nr:hypothetical protein HPB47_010230 [Ixodes persulcatus]